MSIRGLALVAVILPSSFGCAYTTLEARNVPNPVLLGPVDRIGGHRAGSEKTLAHVREEVDDSVSVTTDERRVGNTVVTTQTTTVSITGSGVVTRRVLEATEGRADRDVRVDRIPAGAYLMISYGAAVSSRWVGIEGRAVEVSRDR